MKRKIIRGFVNGENVKLKDIDLEGKKILHVYTILDEDNLFPKFNTQNGEPITERNLDNVVIKHHYSVFQKIFFTTGTLLVIRSGFMDIQAIKEHYMIC